MYKEVVSENILLPEVNGTASGESGIRFDLILHIGRGVAYRVLL